VTAKSLFRRTAFYTGHVLGCEDVSKVTCNVSSGMLNPTALHCTAKLMLFLVSKLKLLWCIYVSVFHVLLRQTVLWVLDLHAVQLQSTVQ